ncbi:MAG: biopolymer transporter ExbD [Myxococcales bacterium]|nr:biopolymer transporter ExbD [Myxococcales bacterium]
MELSTRRREAPQVNLTALIDVVFILVIFVVLAASFTRLRSLEVELPAAEASEPAPQAELTVQIPAAGPLLVAGRATELEGLAVALREAGGRPERPVLILVDAHAEAGRAVAVLGALRAAGYLAVSIAARPPEAR